MAAEVIEALMIRSDGWYVDCTFGRGGHSRAIMAQLDAAGRLVAFDKDQAALDSSEAAALALDKRFQLMRNSFSNLSDRLTALGWSGRVAGVLMDLGVSSPQLDDAERGFSFLRDGPLDMRMDRDSGITAAQWIEWVGEGELEQVLRDYGEERYARRVARAIVSRRSDRPIERTGDLASIVAAAIPRWEKGQHPATRSFQAIRIFINRELEDLKTGLKQAADALQAGGRLVTISFHSLEDRIVKRFMRDESRRASGVRGLPMVGDAPRLRCLGGSRRPSAEEIAQNPRARSAVLRVAERVAA